MGKMYRARGPSGYIQAKFVWLSDKQDPILSKQNGRTLDYSRYRKKFIVFDTETTGVKEYDVPVEIAARKYHINDDGEAIEIDHKDWFIKPTLPDGSQMPMPQAASEVNGITDEFLADKPTENDLFDEIYEFFGDYILVGYNVDFDIGMLDHVYERHGKKLIVINPNTGKIVRPIGIDVLDQARDLIAETETKDYKLGSIVKLLGFDAGLSFHNALDDVTATYRIFRYFWSEYQRLPRYKNMNRPKLYINRMWFFDKYGKYQKGLWIDTPEGNIYLSTFYKCWRSSSVNLEEFDIADLENQVLKRFPYGWSIKKLEKLTAKQYSEATGMRPVV